MAMFPPFAVASIVDMCIQRVLTIGICQRKRDNGDRMAITYHIATPIHIPCIQPILILDETR